MLMVNQLIGFGVGQQSLSELSFVASSTSTASTITLPAGIQAGDLIVIYDTAASNNSTVPTSVVPSGFTPALDQDFASSLARRQIVSYKIADGSESSAVVSIMSGTGASSTAALVFRGDAPISSVTPAGFTSQMTDGNPSAQVIPSGSGAVPLVAVAKWHVSGSGTAINPRTMSPSEDGEITIAGSSDYYVKYKIYNSSPADVTVDMDDEGSRNLLSSGYLAVA